MRRISAEAVEAVGSTFFQAKTPFRSLQASRPGARELRGLRTRRLWGRRRGPVILCHGRYPSGLREQQGDEERELQARAWRTHVRLSGWARGWGRAPCPCPSGGLDGSGAPSQHIPLSQAFAESPGTPRPRGPWAGARLSPSSGPAPEAPGGSAPSAGSGFGGRRQSPVTGPR